MTARATVTQATIQRTIKAVKAEGAAIAEVRVTPDGEVRVICLPVEESEKGWGE